MSEKNKEKKLVGGNHTVQKHSNDNKKKEGIPARLQKNVADASIRVFLTKSS